MDDRSETLQVCGKRLGSTAYDLSTTLHRSNRSFVDSVDSHYVLFNPDFPGNPIVISQECWRLLSAFDQGMTIGEAIGRCDLEFSKALSYIDYFYDHSYLRITQNPPRYRADDRLDNHISNLSFWIHINNHCNLDCSYCFVDKYKATMSDVTIETITSQIRSTVDSRKVKNINITYAGGEPTLSLDTIFKFSSKLRTKLDGSDAWLHEAIITNGTRISDKLIDFIQSNNCSIGISLDGYGAEFHDRHRVFKVSRKGSWDLVESNIQLLLQHGIRPYVMVVVSAETSESLPQLVRWIGERNMNMRLSVVRQPDGQWSPPDWKAAYKRLTDKIIPDFDSAFGELEQEKYSYEWARRIRLCELHFETPSYSTSCGIGSSHVVVQDDGSLASCPMTIRETQVISESDLIRATARTVSVSPRSRNDSTEKNCLDCQWFPVCVSGCPVTNARVKGAPYTISPMHDFYAYVIPRFVRFLGIKLKQAAFAGGNTDFNILDEAALQTSSRDSHPST